MRIVSLLPSLTELVCELGRGEKLVGVTHECDYPPGVELLPHLTRSNIPAGARSGEIDRIVAEHRGSLYELDQSILDELFPDIILTQEQCDVCAVNEATVRRSASNLASQPHVESVNPLDLKDIFAMFRSVGSLLDASDAAESIVERFEETTRKIAARVKGTINPRVIILEWLDPPFSSGHWNPDLIELAGGTEVIGRSGDRSRRLKWSEVLKADPEVLIVSACGFSMERTQEDLAAMTSVREWPELRAVRDGRVYLTDGSTYFSRPGPRLEASLRIAASAIHPNLFQGFAPSGSIRHFPTA